MTRAEFLCPECGSTRPALGQLINRGMPRADDPNPWSAVLHVISCEECGFRIPAHLAERWENLSVSAARLEWREQYRDWPEARRLDG